MSTHPDPATTAIRDWAMIAHLSALVGLFANGIGFVLGPLVVWLWKRDDDEFIKEQALEALNFQITMFIAALASILLMLTVIGIFLGVLLLIVVGALMVIMPIVAAVQAKKGVHYEYPWSLRLVK